MITMPVAAPARVKGAWAFSSQPIVLSVRVEEAMDVLPDPRRVLRWQPEFSPVFGAFVSGMALHNLDVTEAGQVLRGAEGMDAIVSSAVVRRDPLLAFNVNTLGCYRASIPSKPLSSDSNICLT